MEYQYGNYGWLSPDGRYYEVGWGQHQAWADEHIKDIGLYDQLTLKERICATGMGDVMMNHGWILMHNPRGGLAHPTKKEEKQYTKAQAEFLFDYYMERGEKKLAYDIFSSLD